jgi:hypothetical protein
MAGVTCLTLSGDNYWAVVNSVWSLLYEGLSVPSHLILITNGRHKDVAKRASDSLQTLLSFYGMTSVPEIIVVPEYDLRQVHDKLFEIMQKAKSEGEVALNITPARKSLATVAMVAAWETKVNRIHYVYLRSLKDADCPYPLIARDLHELLDLKELRPK